MSTTQSKFKYTAIGGFFQHYNESTDPSFEAVTLPGLGLLDREYDTDKEFDPRRQKQPWERFAYYLDHVNKTEPGVAYKLIYAARHGEGYHNVKEAEVGTKEWEAYWAKLDGDGKMVWADAKLTPTGMRQAQDMKIFWETSVATKLPLPRRHFASPLTRCLQTCEYAFTDIKLPPGDEVPQFRPIIVEMIRERLGVHTCDRRHPRSWIHENYPSFAIEEGFTGEDELWKPDVRETLEEHAGRVEAFLDSLFEEEKAPIVSLAVHSGTILALFEVIGHPAVRSAPGAIVPVLVRAERVIN